MSREKHPHNSPARPSVRIIGAGLAGCQAALWLAEQEVDVELFEMRPERQTEAHQTGHLAELVCSNSFKSLSPVTGPGILKRELALFHAAILRAAELAAVPAGEALAVDREVFASTLTHWVESHPRIRLRREHVSDLSVDSKDLTIVATGPLTSPALASALQRISGEAEFYFYDAISPIVASASIDWNIAFRSNRHAKPTRSLAQSSESEVKAAFGSANPNDEGDYVNCPFTKDEYTRFIEALRTAERVETKNFERVKHFEGCMPIEAMVDRGPETLRFGPMRPIGLVDPRTLRRPWAVVQLRTENREGTMLNLVGFQTKMKYGEQKRVFSLIPGLENAEFLRFGSMHRNAFVHSPSVLNPDLSMKGAPNIFLAGQITGVEGYLESTTIGLVAAVSALARLRGQNFPDPPRGTAMGALLSHLRNTDSPDFQPMGINFGLIGESAFSAELAELAEQFPKARKIPKIAKRERISQCAHALSLAYAKEVERRLTQSPPELIIGADSQNTTKRKPYAEHQSAEPARP